MGEAVAADEETLWTVHSLSPVGTIIPIVLGVLGVPIAIFGLSGAVVPWDETPRSGFLFALAVGGLCLGTGIRRIYFTARRVTCSPDGTFTFISRRRSLTVRPGDLVQIMSPWPLDWSAQYPCRVESRQGSIVVSQRMWGTCDLAEALARANPEADLGKSFVRGVGRGPFG